MVYCGIKQNQSNNLAKMLGQNIHLLPKTMYALLANDSYYKGGKSKQKYHFVMIGQKIRKTYDIRIEKLTDREILFFPKT